MNTVDIMLLLLLLLLLLKSLLQLRMLMRFAFMTNTDIAIHDLA